MRSFSLRLYGLFTSLAQPLVRRKLRRRAVAEPGYAHAVEERFGHYDAAARYLFSLWMGWALLVTGEPVLWLFIVPELAWGLAQSLPLRASGLRQG